jgi:hypothetical protein
MVFSYDVKPSLQVANEAAISAPPAVDFGGASGTPAAPATPPARPASN